ncbi:9427_t:CDS:2 [Cetraspora pellucida]|uniref:9427_t:CDS:1 n=1 Tax=Cetraspora pellucida TaxID=1433469 RepID=A0ACA9NL31_9GLOM|nr:9427_t:CDS:2 [Cetraspora pellucida]
MDDELKLAELIGCLLTDDSLITYEYIYAEDDEVKDKLTEEEILKIIEKAEICMNITLRFLYEQGPEFGDIKEVKILRKLYKQIQLNVVKNLKQVDLHHYFQNMK